MVMDILRLLKNNTSSISTSQKPKTEDEEFSIKFLKSYLKEAHNLSDFSRYDQLYSKFANLVEEKIGELRKSSELNQKLDEILSQIKLPSECNELKTQVEENGLSIKEASGAHRKRSANMTVINEDEATENTEALDEIKRDIGQQQSLGDGLISAEANNVASLKNPSKKYRRSDENLETENKSNLETSVNLKKKRISKTKSSKAKKKKSKIKSNQSKLNDDEANETNLNHSIIKNFQPTSDDLKIDQIKFEKTPHKNPFLKETDSNEFALKSAKIPSKQTSKITSLKKAIESEKALSNSTNLFNNTNKINLKTPKVKEEVKPQSSARKGRVSQLKNFFEAKSKKFVSSLQLSKKIPRIRSSIEQRKARISASKGEIKRKSAIKMKTFINESLSGKESKVNDLSKLILKKIKNETPTLNANKTLNIGSKQVTNIITLNQSCLVKKPKEPELNSLSDKVNNNKSISKASYQMSAKSTKLNSANKNQTISHHRFNSNEIEQKPNEIFLFKNKSDAMDNVKPKENNGKIMSGFDNANSKTTSKFGYIRFGSTSTISTVSTLNSTISSSCASLHENGSFKTVNSTFVSNYETLSSKLVVESLTINSNIMNAQSENVKQEPAGNKLTKNIKQVQNESHNLISKNKPMKIEASMTPKKAPVKVQSKQILSKNVSALATPTKAKEITNKKFETGKTVKMVHRKEKIELAKYPMKENYNISELKSGDETDDEDSPRKPIPSWAADHLILAKSKRQSKMVINFTKLFKGTSRDEIILEDIFKIKRTKFYQRSSSADWRSPPVWNTGGLNGEESFRKLYN